MFENQITRTVWTDLSDFHHVYRINWGIYEEEIEIS